MRHEPDWDLAWAAVLAAELRLARERQIASLAAGGYSDLDIGRRLNISTRTVQTHLAHVYAKIGINRRSQLGEQLGL